MDLGVDFNPAVLRDHVVWDRDAFVDRDALLDYGVVFHAGFEESVSFRLEVNKAKAEGMEKRDIL